MSTEPPLIPQESSPVEVKGKITFSCCGKTQEIQGEKVGQVKCQYCCIVYDLDLVPRLQGVDIHPRGKELLVNKTLKTKLGAGEITIKKGTKVIVGEDSYGMLGTNENQTLVQLESKGQNGKIRVLLAPIPNEFLEAVENLRDGESS